MTRLLLLLALAVTLYVLTSAPQTAPDASTPRSAADINDSPVSMGEDVSVRRLSPAPKEEEAPFPADGRNNPSSLSSAISLTVVDGGSGNQAGGTGAGSAVPSADLPDSAALDLADFALPTPLVGFGGLHPIAESWYRGVAAGKASHMGAAFGPSYLALPIGPGYRVEIVGAGGKVTRVSTDAGPALSMQRPPYNRVADLNVWDFLAVCGVPLSLGLCQVSVTILGRVR